MNNATLDDIKFIFCSSDSIKLNKLHKWSLYFFKKFGIGPCTKIRKNYIFVLIKLNVIDPFVEFRQLLAVKYAHVPLILHRVELFMHSFILNGQKYP